jgi:23S rRNA (adenine2503-C2)-methyltransferase
MSDNLLPAASLTPVRPNLVGFSRARLEDWFVAHGEQRFRAGQVLKWVHQQDAINFDTMTNLSKVLRARLAEDTAIADPEIVTDRLAADGTRKWLLRLADGNHIETVFIPETDRGTLCISSQAGCSLSCSFCHTARQGFSRNLTAAEIIGQMRIATRTLGGWVSPLQRPVTNVVLMGMGEPLMNFDAVVEAISIMTDDLGYGLSRRRVTLSTAGVVPMMDRLREEGGGVSLAVSLHAPNDALRDELVPLNRKYPLKELLAACKRYTDAEARRRITFEYVMLDGVNDRPEHARALLHVLRGVPSKINLIPFNPFAGSGYQTSSLRRINQFRDILMQGGLTTVTRKTRGEDIEAACGQLAGQVADRTKRSERHRAALLTDLSAAQVAADVDSFCAAGH